MDALRALEDADSFLRVDNFGAEETTTVTVILDATTYNLVHAGQAEAKSPAASFVSSLSH
jgi:hypothetical protein